MAINNKSTACDFILSVLLADINSDNGFFLIQDDIGN